MLAADGNRFGALFHYAISLASEILLRDIKKLLGLFFNMDWREYILLANPYNPRIPIDPPEVTGSADVHHLSAVASFRRGRLQLQESQSTSTSAKTMSPMTDNRSPLIHASQSIIYEEPVDKSGGSDFISSLPVLRPTYPPLELAPELMSQGLDQRNALQIIPSAGVMVQDGAMLQPSIDDYIKTADEMSTYLTLGILEIPPWLNLPDHLPPG